MDGNLTANDGNGSSKATTQGVHIVVYGIGTMLIHNLGICNGLDGQRTGLKHLHANNVTATLGELDGFDTRVTVRIEQVQFFGLLRILGRREDNFLVITTLVAGSGEHQSCCRRTEKKYFFHRNTTK